jgi:hypothetical protein
MSKKIAFFLILVMFVNMAAWSDVTVEEALEAGVPVWGILLIIFGVVGLSLGLTLALSEADAPDDGIRMASIETANTVPETGSGSSILNFLQHIEVGQAEKDNFYIGLRFRFK